MLKFLAMAQTLELPFQDVHSQSIFQVTVDSDPKSDFAGTSNSYCENVNFSITQLQAEIYLLFFGLFNNFGCCWMILDSDSLKVLLPPTFKFRKG